jgi:hypothetical protein
VKGSACLLFQQLSGRIEEISRKTSVVVTGLLAENWILDLSNTNHNWWPIDWRSWKFWMALIPIYMYKVGMKCCGYHKGYKFVRRNCTVRVGLLGNKTRAGGSGAQIWAARSSGRLNFLRWRLIFVSSQYGYCFISPSWRPEFWDGSKIFRKFCKPLVYVAGDILRS